MVQEKTDPNKQHEAAKPYLSEVFLYFMVDDVIEKSHLIWIYLVINCISTYIELNSILLLLLLFRTHFSLFNLQHACAVVPCDAHTITMATTILKFLYALS